MREGLENPFVPCQRFILRIGKPSPFFLKKTIMENILHRIESVVEWTFKWFIVYLLVGEFLFLTMGYILPTFIF